jgi:hypothetical protein
VGAVEGKGKIKIMLSMWRPRSHGAFGMAVAMGIASLLGHAIERAAAADLTLSLSILG